MGSDPQAVSDDCFLDNVFLNGFPAVRWRSWPRRYEMNFITLGSRVTEGSMLTMGEFPVVASMHAELIEERPRSNGGHSLDVGRYAHLPQDARVISDRYDVTRNKLMLTVLTNGGAVQRVFRARLSLDKRIAAGIKLFRVKVLRIPPPMEHGGKGIFQDMQGKEYKFPRRKLHPRIQEKLSDWINEVYRNGIPNVDWTKVPKGVKDALNFDELQKCTWTTQYVRDCRAAGRVAYQLLHAPSNPLEMSVAVESGLLPYYPVIDIPGKVLHKWNTFEKIQYMGVIQEGGASNYTKNIQTANRISAAIGEPVTPEQLLKLKFTHVLNSIYLGNGISCYPFAVITKITKEA